MDSGNDSKNCENCNRRFNAKQPTKRRRHITGRETLLLKLNNERRLRGLQPLEYHSVICHGCFRKYEYAASSRSSSSLEDEAMEMEISEPEGSDPDTGSVGEQEHTFVPPAIPGSSMQAQSMRILEICSLCNMALWQNANVGIRPLRTVELFRILINGERAGTAQPLVSGEQLVCNNCLWQKMNYFAEGWRVLNLNLYPQVENQPGGNNDNVHDIPVEDDQSDASMEESEEADSDLAESEAGSSEYASSSEEEEAVAPPIEVGRMVCVEKIHLPIARIAVSGHQCCICGKENIRTHIKKTMRSEIWIKLGIYISNHNRFCGEPHLDSEGECYLNAEAVTLLKHKHIYDETEFTKPALLEFISSLTEYSREMRSNVGRLSFKKENMYSSFEHKVLLSVSPEHFDHLHSICRPFLRSRKLSTRDTVAIFLMKMRLNTSLRAIGVFFNVSESAISRAVKKVRTILITEFVPYHLGYGHISRQEYIDNHTTVISKTLTGATNTQAISVIDGTYFYCNKSGCFKFQRKSFSMHKYKNLFKAMIIASTTGYILDVEGPYFGDGDNNDSNIMRSMCRDANGFRSFFMPGDFIIEDRGFRDSNTLMTNLGYSVKMPHFLGRRAQHPTSEANESRLVTKIRWIVEAVNGRIKMVYRIFRDTFPNSYIKKNRAYEFLRIACAMLNAFHPPIATDKEGDREMAQEMLVRSTMHNLFMEHLISENYIRSTAQWILLNDNDLDDFPRLTSNELRGFTFGVYQIAQARSYISDSRDETGSYDLFYQPILGKQIIRFKMQSRHHSSSTHFVWLGYISNGMGIRSIAGWYCKCPNGARIVGCCSHIAAILWYLSYARYLGRVVPPGADLATLIRDAPTYRYEEEFLDVPTREEERQRAEHALRPNNETGAVESESNDKSDSSSGSWLT